MISDKKVLYNGGTDNPYGCTEPTELVKGREYEVRWEDNRGTGKVFVLKGICGCFNVDWFYVIPTIYLAEARNIPEINHSWDCTITKELTGLNPERINVLCQVDKVIDVKQLSKDIYCIRTKYCVFLTTII